MERLPGALPPFEAVLDECGAVLGHLAARSAPASPAALDRMAAALERIRSAIATAGLPPRPLHGDASRGNLLRTPDGLLWTDFEDCCAGPVEWDLACLACSGGAEAEAEGPLGPFVEARRLQGDLWTALLAARHPDLRPRAEERLRRWG